MAIVADNAPVKSSQLGLAFSKERAVSAPSHFRLFDDAMGASQQS